MPYERYVDLFFYYLAHSLLQSKATEKLPNSTLSDIITFPKDADVFFEYVASNIANKLLGLGKIDVLVIYEQTKVFKFPERLGCHSDEALIWHAASKALTQISIIIYRLFNTDRILSLIDVNFER